MSTQETCSQIIEKFRDAATAMLRAQAGLKASPIENLEQFTTAQKEECISGSVEVVEGPFQGTLSFFFPKSTYLKLISKTLGVEETEVTPELADGVAEFANTVMGQAKVGLKKSGFGVKMGLPNVGNPKNPDTTMEPPVNWIVAFDSEAGPFAMEFRFRTFPAANPPAG